MKKSILAASAALACLDQPQPALLTWTTSAQLGLIVSGVVDQWAGVQFINEENGPSDAFFANGGEGLLSLPLGTNLSIQSDIKYEYNRYRTRSAKLRRSMGAALFVPGRSPLELARPVARPVRRFRWCRCG